MTCDEAILKVNDHGFVWVDTRPVALYKQSSILGAKHISELKPIKVKSNKKPKYLYFCQQGSTSMKLAQKDNQHYLKGGFDAWLSQHLPVKKEE